MNFSQHLSFVLVLLLVPVMTHAEDVTRTLPDDWQGLVDGASFSKRFLPLPEVGELTDTTWGTNTVRPRHTNNGIEDATWSYWGGNIIKGDDGKYHMFVCRWREDDPKGHWAWPKSEVVHAISNTSIGPFRVNRVVGPGHNPEVHQLQDGSYFLYVHKFGDFFYYHSDSLSGPWKRKPFTFNTRQRPIVDHMANSSFVKRQDGSMLMVSRGGGIWISETGLPPYELITQNSVYPSFEGKYEDPVIWRTHVQYHMIVNDWLGRVAYYLRSKDGIKWKLDPGVAYAPGVARHTDGRIEQWYKFERIKVFQDEYGRAFQANFAVNDVAKNDDLGSDNHSSKNISIPLVKGRLIQLLSSSTPTAKNGHSELLIRAEPDFNPLTDVDIKTLQFGAPEKVNFGKGARVIARRAEGKDLILTFANKDLGFSDNNFAGKLLGYTEKSELLFGFTRLPWVSYEQSIVSAEYPTLTLNGNSLKVDIDIKNFGLANSTNTEISIEVYRNSKWLNLAEGKIPVLAPYEQHTVTLWSGEPFSHEDVVEIRILLHDDNHSTEVLSGKVIVR